VISASAAAKKREHFVILSEAKNLLFQIQERFLGERRLGMTKAVFLQPVQRLKQFGPSLIARYSRHESKFDSRFAE
jgi:hypothetical protein